MVVSPSPAVERARDPEVGDLRRSVQVDDDVVRLHVPVHDAVLVREREPVRDLADEGERVADGQRPLPLDELLDASRPRRTRRR